MHHPQVRQEPPRRVERLVTDTERVRRVEADAERRIVDEPEQVLELRHREIRMVLERERRTVVTATCRAGSSTPAR